MTEFLFLRHAQTHANAAGRWQGWSDPPLNAKGRAQAEAAAARLAAEHEKIGAIYTSPLRRARQTAQALGRHLALGPQIVNQLKEIHFGELEGTTLSQMKAEFPRLHARWQDKTDMAFQWPGGEQRADFFERVAEACEWIRARHGCDKVVVVAHGGTIRACLAHLLPRQLGRWWTYSLDNCGVTWVRATETAARLLMLNDVSHLPAQEER